MRRRASVGQTLVVILLTAALSVGVFTLSRPQIVVGDPLPRLATYRYRPKPQPPKAQGQVAADKPVTVDLGPTPAPVSVASPDDPVALSLGISLQQALEAAGDTGQTGIYVMDADGTVLYDRSGTVPLIPASTSKIVTAAMVLATFGPDHVFTTRVAATTPPDATGVVAGNLVLIGGGDPSLVSQTYIDAQTDPERPQTPISALADQIAAAGITTVEGSVVGDPAFLRGQTLADGWPPRYLEDLDATPISGLTIDQGLEFYDDDGRIRARAAADPSLQAAAALTQALIDRGITVAGQPQSLLEQETVMAMTPVAAVDSPSVMTLLTRVVQRSDNHMADTLFRAAGRHAVGTGSFTDAAGLAQELLAALQLDWSTTALADGSGLSRSSTIPPALLTTLNYRMTNSAVGTQWQDLMAIAGVSGTLERRLVGSIAELRLRGKTGSLADVRALTGAVVGPDGRPLYFTVISNDLSGEQLGRARRLQDLVVLALAAQLYGCTEVPPPPPEQPLLPDELPPLPTHSCSI
ncbi:MAG: D-alanyl-D-alanine carboxypeptidase/D-alanyl-D-alanine endopeptidase [Euzebya sp.]